MNDRLTKLEITANNLANASTTGFKRTAAFDRAITDAQNNQYNMPGDSERADTRMQTFIDFSNGNYEKTDNPLDIAIENEGFFELQDEAGNTLYTRNGHFQLSRDGTITAMDGKKLMGMSGALSMGTEFTAEPLQPTDTKAVDVKITENGEVFANDYFVGALKIATIENPASLRRASKQDFAITEDTIVSEVPPEKISVRQGWLEDSNVNVISEMVEMINLQRQFEAGSKVIRSNEETLSNSIRMGTYY